MPQQSNIREAPPAIIAAAIGGLAIGAPASAPPGFPRAPPTGGGGAPPAASGPSPAAAAAARTP